MKHALVIAVAGLALGLLAYTGMYRSQTASRCCLQESEKPELAWLKEEFHVSDAEFKRVSELHEQYLAGCQERCKLIDEKYASVARLLTATNTVTPEIERMLNEAAMMRADCQKKMLQHCYEVSRTMPPEQGRRYLAWIQSKTIAPDVHSTMHHH